MESKVISIIGGKGKMGSLFAKAFKEYGCKVIISDTDTKLSNKEAAKIGDIVIVTVPIRKTQEVISEIVPYIKENALLTDFTSVKINPCKAMRKNKQCEVVGGHPLFGPSVGFNNQNFIFCPVQRNKEITKWYKKFLTSLGLNVIEMTPKNHDKEMAVIQGLTHFSSISLGHALKSLNYNLKSAEELSSPVYLMRIYGAGRILAQDSELYSDIQIENPYSKKMAESYYKTVKELCKTVKKNDKNGFEKIFITSKNYFGDVCKKSMDITNKMIKVLSDK